MTKRRSARGNWLVVSCEGEEIVFCTWVHSWAGAQMSKRNAEKYIQARAARNAAYGIDHEVGRVLILDIERMIRFAKVSEELGDIYSIWARRSIDVRTKKNAG